MTSLSDVSARGAEFGPPGACLKVVLLLVKRSGVNASG